MTTTRALPDIGPYRFVTPLAIGGMAEVFRALRRQSAGADRAVVIKRMLPALAADPEARAMFAREARLGMRIRHPNVVEVLDEGMDGDLPYLVLEYVFGVDLRRLMRFVARSGRSLPTSLVLWVAHQLLAGLHAVHTASDEHGAPLHVVHRDVSPSNVFLSVHGDVKLGDLGIAVPLRREGRTPSPMRRGAGARGKLGYLAPEQVAGGEATPACDVFSAAVVVAELLLGTPLFRGGTELAVLLAIREADVSPLRAIAQSLPPDLVDALLAGLARDPAERIESADALRRALAAHLPADVRGLRDALGALVVAALDAGGEVDRASLARTTEHTAGAPAPRAAPSAMVPEPDGAGRVVSSRLFDLDSPGVGPVWYEVRHAGRALGRWTYARVVQALRTSEIDGSSEVRVEGGAPRPIAQVPELARHVRAPSVLPSAPAARAEPTGWSELSPFPPETAESHDLSRRSLAAVLLELLASGQSGMLLCERGEIRKEIYLDRGVPTFVTSNRLDELLGERLVRDGVVDRAELDLALAVMPRFEGRLGDTLIALGLVDPLVLFRRIAEQVHEKLLDVFLWPDGRAAFYRGVEPSDRSFPLRREPWALLEEGMRARIAAGLEPSPARALVRVRDADLPVPEPWRALADALSEPRTLAQLEADAPDAMQTRAIALLLIAAGIAQWSP